MKHYDQQHWKAYVLNIVDEGERVEMENHLYNCDECMDLYIQQLDELDDCNFNESPAFTETIMKRVYTYENKRNRDKRSKLFRYYVIAASITIILVYTGAFEAIGSKTPDLMTALNTSTDKIETAMFGGWSNGLLDKSRDFINQINFNIKE